MRLGVNIDHVATLRQLRGTDYPHLLAVALLAKEGGADQITIHLREDRRHIQNQDVSLLKSECSLPLNLEMAATEEMLDIAGTIKPHTITLVPERRMEKTTESGIDLRSLKKEHLKLFSYIKKGGVRISFFIDPNLDQISLAKEWGGDQIEFHTGPYCHAFDQEKEAAEIKRLQQATAQAKKSNITVAAGHGLHYKNLSPLLVALPEIEEYNIGHSIICRAVFVGMKQAVAEMKQILTKGAPV